MSRAERPEWVGVEDYLAAEEVARVRNEYVEGWVRAMTGGTHRHSRVKVNCLVTLANLLAGSPCQPFDSDAKVRIRSDGKTRFYYPDLQVVCESNALTDVYQDRSVMIVEVLSPSTRVYDLDEKLDAYLAIASLECYIILEQHRPFVIVMRRTTNGFLCETYEGIEATIALPFVRCSLPLQAIYERVEFTPTEAETIAAEQNLSNLQVVSTPNF